MMDYVWAGSEKMLVMENEHQPFIVFIDGGFAHFANVAQYFSDEKGKDMVSQILHQIALKPSVEAIAFISEGYVLQLSPENPEANQKRIERANKLGVSEDPESVECLQAQVETRSPPSSITRVAEIVRDSDGNVVMLKDEKNIPSVSTGRFSNLFSRGQA